MDGYIGEIRAFGFNFPPVGWALCNGQSMNMQQQAALYAVIGQRFGGSGTTFNLPNLQGCAAMDAGTGPGLTPRTVGQPYGQNSVTLISNQLPPHSHSVKVVMANNGGDAANSADPNNNYWAKGFKPGTRGQVAAPTYLSSTTKTQAVMAPNMVQPAGAVTPAGHTNMQPYLVFNMCICLDGEFPIRS